MPQFKHRVTGVTREWRTDNEDVFRRLYNKGWRQVAEEAVEVAASEPASPSTAWPGDWPEWLNDTQRASLFNAGWTTMEGLQVPDDDKYALVEKLVQLDGIGKVTAKRLVWGVS